MNDCKYLHDQAERDRQMAMGGSSNGPVGAAASSGYGAAYPGYAAPAPGTTGVSITLSQQLR